MEENSPGLVCLCMGITAGEIIKTISEEKLTTVKEIGKLIGAGTGCGRCRPVITTILHQCNSSDIQEPGNA